ncbi:Transcriptional regulator GlxA family, contains an amidase domain and an AraC-type DNA-binding HTH domain [Duganella sp. CF402]|uniref:GlxA family transcriptional regulator n=1 Tax=unclassified Duganella TaxID=2636909 RepID=UPI0008C566D6|nr:MULTISPECIES: GlxA family transcriptional regulator [unclassified Duganella]RZT04230.1 transcriptional regulator GlxA family with amidase domain [Duganella sp. BK701]SEM43377.1 Transcriptional regulator GlxA family, contains an amidase domain and an AraC-type DNA-binding HTH domain [Duganella sp. CF402]
MKKTIGLMLFPGFQIVDLAAVTVFEVANGMPGGPYYEMHMLSEHGGAVPSSSGVPVVTQRFDAPDFDTIMVAGAMEVLPSTPAFVAFLREASQASRRTASICTGAFQLAEAGLLDGRRVTTHWALARELQRQHPRTRVEEDRIFIEDDRVWSSAGMTACIDLALALVEADHGVELARAVARKMVVYHRRTGGQSQFSALLELEPKSDRIQTALTYAKRNLRKALSVDELADAAHLSRRQFTRTFRLETGQSPAKAVETLRVEAARMMLEEGNHAIDVVAREVGFDDPERMRRAFIRAYGMPPQALKRAARSAA